MLGASLVTWLWIVGAGVGLAFAAVMILKTLAGLKEEDVVILDPAEDNLANEQRETVARVEKLTVWAKCFGFSALGIFCVAAVMSLTQALHFKGQ